MSKITKPINPLIFKTAASLAITWFDAARSSGLPAGKYVGRGDKGAKLFVQDHIEKFIPLSISYLIEMLKPTSNCNAHMREEIYTALMDPLNDPEMMAIGRTNTKKQNEQMVLKAIQDFDKNKIKFNIAPLAVPTDKPKDLKSSTSLS